jgi:hypothetical protein
MGRIGHLNPSGTTKQSRLDWNQTIALKIRVTHDLAIAAAGTAG